VNTGLANPEVVARTLLDQLTALGEGIITRINEASANLKGVIDIEHTDGGCIICRSPDKASRHLIGVDWKRVAGATVHRNAEDEGQSVVTVKNATGAVLLQIMYPGEYFNRIDAYLKGCR